MSVFEVVFSLTGLVLGLALVEVLSGLAKTMRSRAKIRAGLLSPLLAVWVLSDVTSFWGMAWEVRELLPSVWPSLGVGLVLTSVYYLAASLVFPSDFQAEPDLDAYYWRNRRTVVGLLLACNLVAWGLGLSLGRSWSPLITAINASYLVAMLTALIVSGRTANLIALGVLIAIQVWALATP